MIKVLIISEEYDIIKKIVNNILVNVEEINIVGITNSIKEAEIFLENTYSDLIISTIPQIIDLIKNNFSTYKPNFIIFTNKRIKNKSTKEIMYEYHSTDPIHIANRISKFINSSIIYSQKEKLCSLLKKLGFDFKWKGTFYLLDAVHYIRTCKGAHEYEFLSKNIYEYVAKQNNTDSCKVRWAIARAVQYMCETHTKSTYSTIENFFEVKYPDKPSPKSIINILASNFDL